ncbi:GDSL-like lipase/acylhydrolase family protein [Stackebrandtia albiflava]|uniref:GDSL-like lipase/acylhydrolase family protein n=1 Tax=Stackebrandtia albiflava TaxID=406432 RepID=A0A562UYX5_9ACTN|nr:ricin-type beta-trefoil lectin domain protein [Stackebrandtia albiflava]TWJ10758.1 GDSL-like lipase/acylhydrolase family protein [Stackebrandtia albiflava]
MTTTRTRHASTAPPPRPRPAIRRLALLGALVMAATTPLAAPASADPATPAVQDLPPALEEIRAAQAVELYGSPEIRPREERLSSLVTMGDSQISGEGVGNYEPDTHRDGNWCDRSYDQAVFRTGIASDVQYNIACSGAASPHLVQSTGATQWDELNQGDQLAIKARNTDIELIWITIGANDDGGIEFGPVATQCITDRVLFRGPCWSDYTDGWAARVEVTEDGVENAIDGIRQTMTDAGYLATDYQFVVMSYGSPASPDVEDNPDFPGWYRGGCLMYLADAAFARNKAVPLFEAGVREAALSKGVRYLDAGRLMDGHAVCDDNTWVRGLTVEVGVLPSEHAFRQSMHPNYRGHGAFAQCVTQFYANPSWQAGTCVDPASTGNAVVYEGLFEFRDIRDGTTGLCVDAEGYDSRNGTALQAYGCHGGRNQGFYQDQTQQSLHVELSHDRCVDVADGDMSVGGRLVLWDCHGGTNQDFTVDSTGIHPVAAPSLCLGFESPAAGAALVLTDCGTAGSLRLTARDYADPVGYGHDDWIGASVY